MQLTECTCTAELMQWLLANPNIENDISCVALLVASDSSEKKLDTWICDNLDWLKEHITIRTRKGMWSVEFFIGDWRWLATSSDKYFSELANIAEQQGHEIEVKL